MTTTASVQFRTEFEPLVKHAYQGNTKLLNTVRTRMNANARTVSFPKLGKGTASLRIPGANVTPMNATHTAVTTTIYDYDASDYSYVEDLDKISFDEKQELVKVAGGAVGRGIDQVIIDAMIASSFATAVAISEGGANTSLNIEKFTKASALLNANGVPSSDRYMAVTADALMNALRETEVGSAEYIPFKLPTYQTPANSIGSPQVPQPYNMADMYTNLQPPRFAAQGGMMETQGAFPANPLTMQSNPAMAMGAQPLPMNTPGVPMNVPMGFANGGMPPVGIASLAAGGYPPRTGQISGPGTEKSDSIPAMLSDGEFVMTASAVRGAGKGSRREGAKKMYKLMHQLEKNSERG